MQQLGIDIAEALQSFETCDQSNVIHAAKITRIGEAHKQSATQYLARVKNEVDRQKRDRNSCTKSGGKHLSAAISEQKGKPMTNIVRDRDTDDGGKKGQITSNPADIDGIVRRAWQAIHKRSRRMH